MGSSSKRRTPGREGGDWLAEQPTLAEVLAPAPELTPLRIPHPVRRLFGESRGVTWAVAGILVVLGMLLVRPMAMSLLSWHRTAAMLDERRTEVEQLERRNRALRTNVEYFRTSEYIIEQARAYGMVAQGEHGFVIRELAHPESANRFVTSRLRNATVDHPTSLTEE